MKNLFSIVQLVVFSQLFAFASMADAEVRTLSVYPDHVGLPTARSRVQLVVTGIDRAGNAIDLTRQATYRASDPALRVSDHGVVTTHADGDFTLEVSAGDKSLNLEVTSRGQTESDPIRFRSETAAVLTKQGCNAGSCHGSPRGKGGFSLSLFAFDPELDKKNLVRSGFNRRTNVYEPEQSLLLRKPLLRAPHVGGKRLRLADAAYDTLYHWILEGANDDSADAPDCIGIEVHPGPNRILRAPAIDQQLLVLAHFSDGTRRDVTHIATYDTSGKEVVHADADGLVRGKERGQAAITVRYLQYLKSVYFTVQRDVDGFVWKEVPEFNYVDQLVNKRLRLLQYEAGDTCTDNVFLRRVFLDLTGLLPTREEAHRFIADRDPEKRSGLIDRLLANDSFAYYQGLRMADLMRVNPEILTDGRAHLFADWIAESIASNKPFDEMTRVMLTASGDTLEVAPANYFAAITETRQMAEATAQIFMGSRIQCARCHNHPFENWTQNDYYSFGSVFHGLRTEGTSIQLASNNMMANPRTGQLMKPWGMDPDKAKRFTSGNLLDARDDFVHWLTSPENDYFSRVEVNRIWAHLFGRGIVDPIDDFRSSNPPANVELLAALAEDFVSSGYDRKHIFRVICNSQTYQRTSSSTPQNERDEELFSRQQVRLLTAEQLLDAIGYTTGQLASIEKINAIIRQLRNDMVPVEKELEQNQAAWETEQRLALERATFHQGSWWHAGPYGKDEGNKLADADEVIVKPQPPEDNLVVDVSHQPGGRSWEWKKDWQLGSRVNFEKSELQVRYVYTSVYANKPFRALMRCIADDGMKVWHNGTVSYENPQIDASDENQTSEVELHEGWNHFLIKVANKGGEYHFTFNIEYISDANDGDFIPADVAGYAAEILRIPEDQRTVQQHRVLRHYYIERDGRLPKMREQIMQSGRMEFATQRPYPAGDDFLKAFGQPERSSPCVCERGKEPTLEQALQLLNGKMVYERVLRSVEVYGNLENEQLVDQLYYSALSRNASHEERSVIEKHLNEAENRTDAIQDVVWALINSQEFMFQH